VSSVAVFTYICCVVLINELDTTTYTMMGIIILLVSKSYTLLSSIDVMMIHVGEKLFDTVEDVVADGLITLFMEKHNADSYLQRQRSSIISSSSIVNGGSVRQQKPLPKLPSCLIDNDLNKDLRCALTPIVEQEFNFDDKARPQIPITNGYNADPTMSIMPCNDHDPPSYNDVVNSPEDSVVCESQVSTSPYLVLCVIVMKTCSNNNGRVLVL